MGDIQYLAPLALVLGIIARKRIRNNPSLKGNGLAITGIILGGIGSIFIFFSYFRYGLRWGEVISLLELGLLIWGAFYLNKRIEHYLLMHLK